MRAVECERAAREMKMWALFAFSRALYMCAFFPTLFP